MTDKLAAAWDDLRVLLAIARTGSLGRAATELGLTQPTVGRRLDRLEEAIGVPLVRRTARGCELSERALALLPLVERMQEAADGVTRIASSAHNDLAGLVRVATGDLPARFLARRLPELLGGAPGLRLEIVSGAGFVSLERGEADIAVRTVAPAGDGWVVHRLGTVPYAVYAAPAYVASHPEVLRPEGQREAAWVGFGAGSTLRSARWLRDFLGREPDVAFSASLLVLEGAACGAGLAVLPVYVGDDEPRLRRIGPPLEGLGFDSVLVVHPSSRRLPRVRWVAARLREVLQRANTGD
ncbi:MAG: LysR family transcriptional regulator [Alphaproteobacteria bacterium]|nr:LysR family transcriptional regulator [Alphaproteobacteria bacterium]MCB9692344.1 LysR family transcriptional regulator [Alphaproteobacteria bacterium]